MASANPRVGDHPDGTGARAAIQSRIFLISPWLTATSTIWKMSKNQWGRRWRRGSNSIPFHSARSRRGRGGITRGNAQGAPFHLLAPELAAYRQHGHRRLDARTYESKCTTCVWGCKMPVEIIRDHWNRSRGPDNVTRRFETFCYGPADCTFYKAGPKRTVRGRKGMVYEDDGDSTGDR